MVELTNDIQKDKINDKIFQLERELELIPYRIEILKDYQKDKWNSFYDYFREICFPGCSANSTFKHSGMNYDSDSNTLYIYSLTDYEVNGCNFDSMVPDVIMVAELFGVRVLKELQ